MEEPIENLPSTGDPHDPATVIALGLQYLAEWEEFENERRELFYLEKDIRDWKHRNINHQPDKREPVPDPPLKLHIDLTGYPAEHPKFIDGPEFVTEPYVPPEEPPPPPPGQVRMSEWTFGDGTGRRLAMAGDTMRADAEVKGPDGLFYRRVVRQGGFGNFGRRKVGWYEPL